MKKVAVFGSDNVRSLASVVGFLKEALITAVAPLNSPFYELAKSLNIEVVESLEEKTLQNFDVLLEYDIEAPNVIDVEVLKLHPSLLPSFDSKDPIKDAYLAGVKVSGVTVYSVSRDKILAQFPVLVENDFHFEDYVESITKAENLLYPLVIKSQLENKIFNFTDIIGGSSSGCSGNCGSCAGGCK